MPTLPVIPLATSTVAIAGVEVPIRSLSRAEVLRLNDYRNDEAGAEVHILMCGTGCTEEEAVAFRRDNDAATAGILVNAIVYLSGIAEPPDEDGVAPKGRSRKPTNGR